MTSILALSGSLRRASFNTGLVRAAIGGAPAGIAVTTFDLRPLPFYDGDVEAAGFPAPVAAFRAAVAAADGILLCSPEHNASVSALLKNALDWASRPPGVVQQKPIALAGATPGGFGTVRGQMHFRHLCVFTNMHPLNKPEVLVSKASDKIDAEGRVHDPKTREQIQKQLEALGAWTRRLRGH